MSNNDKHKGKRQCHDSDFDSDTDLALSLHDLNLSSKTRSIVGRITGSTDQGFASSSKTLALADLKLSDAFFEVSDLPLETVQRRIQELSISFTVSILSGKGFSFNVPSRAANYQHYIPELDRIVLQKNSGVRDYANVSSVRKATITSRVMSLIHHLVIEGIHTTKRDLFYSDAKLFKAQRESNSVLDDLSCILGCARTSMNVVASEKGVVVGRLVFSENGDKIDCTTMGIGGKAIPPFIDSVWFISSDAFFILLVEKDATFIRLSEDKFYNKFPCIILTGKGQPDVASWMFLRKMKMELNLPVLALVDSDPYGLKILSVY